MHFFASADFRIDFLHHIVLTVMNSILLSGQEKYPVLTLLLVLYHNFFYIYSFKYPAWLTFSYPYFFLLIISIFILKLDESFNTVPFFWCCSNIAYQGQLFSVYNQPFQFAECGSMAYLLFSEYQICDFKTKVFQYPCCIKALLSYLPLCRLKEVVKAELFLINQLTKIQGVIFCIALLFGARFLWDFFAVSDYWFASCSPKLEAVDPLYIQACYPSEVLGKITRLNK